MCVSGADLLHAQQPAAAPQATQASQSLTLEEVVRFVQAGLAEDLIVARLKRNNKPFDLTSVEIVELKGRGVSDTLMKFLIDPAQPYTPPAPPPPAAGPPVVPPPIPPKPPLDPLVLKLPVEKGVYWMDAMEKVTELELKPVVASKQPGKTKIPFGKGHVMGSLPGASAKAKLPAVETNLYARIMNPVEDLVLVQTEGGGKHRDLDFGLNADKPVFPPKSVRQFESKDVGQGVIRISLPKLDPGEYLLFILGSGEEKKGTLGKGWEFAVK
jgi:hypothetical protein